MKELKQWFALKGY